MFIGSVSESSNGNTISDTTRRHRLKIIGGGPLLEEMKSYAKTKDKSKIIEFLGHKSHDEVIKLIKNCRFVVIPSEWYENFPYSILETYACGKPAIGSRIGGIIELIKDTERGILFEPGNSNDLSAAINFLLNNPDIVEEMGKNARDFITKELTAEKHYQKLIKIYEHARLERLVHTS